MSDVDAGLRSLSLLLDVLELGVNDGELLYPEWVEDAEGRETEAYDAGIAAVMKVIKDRIENNPFRDYRHECDGCGEWVSLWDDLCERCA